MTDEDRFPRHSYDLVEFLDGTVNRPSFPVSANAFANMDDAAIRSAAFTAGARSVVDMLMAWRDEEIEDAEAINGSVEVGTDSVSDESGGTFPRIYGTDGDLREGTSPSRVAGIGVGPSLVD